MDSFSTEVIRELKHYVYRLIDPRDGNTFYVGVGQGNRVFAHVRDVLKPNKDEGEDDDSSKLDYIRRLIGKGLMPIHVIHRHGLSRNVADEVEAALIDCYPGLTNEVAGKGSFERGTATVEEIEEKHAAKIMKPLEGHKLLYIKTRASTVADRGLYEAVRASWNVSKQRVKKAHYVIAVVDQICRGVFVAEKWEFTPDRKRYQFHGREAPNEILEHYRGKRIPPEYRKRGMAAPVLYGYC